MRRFILVLVAVTTTALSIGAVKAAHAQAVVTPVPAATVTAAPAPNPQFYNGYWWYRMPDGRWLYYVNGQWVNPPTAQAVAYPNFVAPTPYYYPYAYGYGYPAVTGGVYASAADGAGAAVVGMAAVGTTNSRPPQPPNNALHAPASPMQSVAPDRTSMATRAFLVHRAKSLLNTVANVSRRMWISRYYSTPAKPGGTTATDPPVPPAFRKEITRASPVFFQRELPDRRGGG